MRIAIIGAGVAGLTAAWELRRRSQHNFDVSIYEASNRLGGIIQTVHEGGFTIETGPDAWLTAKPWASDLARELGLSQELVPSLDAGRRTWIYLNQKLQAVPDRMSLMVPSDLEALEGSSLFSAEAIGAYRAEPGRARELLAQAPQQDESVEDFTLRHFGPEVLHSIAAPLLSGVFGGDVRTLSAHAALPALVSMERSHGSLIAALQAQRAAVEGSRAGKEAASLFTSLRTGMGTLIDRLVAQLPPAWLRLNTTVVAIRPLQQDAEARWSVTSTFAGQRTVEQFDSVLLALPADAARSLLQTIDPVAAKLLPGESSSALLVAYAFADASQVPVPPGFGLLVPPASGKLSNPFHTEQSEQEYQPDDADAEPHTLTLLQACTFVDQKFADRVPPGGRLLRAFFGGSAASRLAACNNDEVSAIGRLELARVLHSYTHAAAPLRQPAPSPLPEPLITVVRRLPRSLPQYAVGHLERASAVSARLSALRGLVLLGNSLNGLGIPDVIRDARNAAAAVLADL